MTVHVTPATLWAGARATLDTGLDPALAQRSIAFDLEDPRLEAMLRTLVANRIDLVETDGAAAVTITDRAGDSDTAGTRLAIGAADGRNNLDSRDPNLILAAATLVAAGYAVERREPGPRRAPLSQREQQVAALLIEGASNKVIARALDISVHTAKFHVTAILDKLGARNRADAVSILLRERLIAA
jgi:DNA-binding CsgD family transcriptional regulator